MIQVQVLTFLESVFLKPALIQYKHNTLHLHLVLIPLTQIMMKYIYQHPSFL